MESSERHVLVEIADRQELYKKIRKVYLPILFSWRVPLNQQEDFPVGFTT